jgi:hypothetical protein
VKFFKFLRPDTPFFGANKWVFRCATLFPAAMLLLSASCVENGTWPAATLLSILVMACFWEAHVQTLPLHLASRAIRLWRICTRALRTLLSVAFAGLPIFVLIGIIIPQYSCGLPDRVRVSKVSNTIRFNTSALQREIERRASVTKTLKGAGLGLTLPPPRQDAALTALSNGFVLEDGTIVLVIEEPPATVRFTPKLVDAHSGAIEWSCRGYPAKSVPMKCREPE